MTDTPKRIIVVLLTLLPFSARAQEDYPLKHRFAATTNPTADDDESLSLGVSSQWYNVVEDRVFVCLDGTDGAAVWREITGLPGGAQYLVGAPDPTLTAERVATNTPTVGWDYATPGEAKASIPDNAVTDAILRDSVASSVIGRSAASTGDPADIAAGAGTNHVLRENGGDLSFGTVASGGIAAGAVDYSKLTDSAASTLLGRGSAGGTGDPQPITLGSGLAMTGTVLSAGAAAGITTLRKTADQTINAGAGVFVDIANLTFPVVSGTDYAFEFYIAFRSANTATGWKSGVNHPGGTLDFWAMSDVIANGAAGVATHTERHNVAVNDMTLLTATITAGVDLAVTIKGRYKCTANGTFAARFANELAANTDIVVQKGSWGWWF